MNMFSVGIPPPDKNRFNIFRKSNKTFCCVTLAINLTRIAVNMRFSKRCPQLVFFQRHNRPPPFFLYFIFLLQ